MPNKQLAQQLRMMTKPKPMVKPMAQGQAPVNVEVHIHMDEMKKPEDKKPEESQEYQKIKGFTPSVS